MKESADPVRVFTEKESQYRLVRVLAVRAVLAESE
jgi:hypothetical protein